MPQLSEAPVNPQKHRKGLQRIWHATGYSIAGLRAGWTEPAFRQEAILCIFMLPLSIWLGKNWIEVALLAGSVILVMVVEVIEHCLVAVQSDSWVMPLFLITRTNMFII